VSTDGELAYPAERRVATLRPLEAQRMIDLIGLKAMPALAAGLLAYLHLGDAGYGVLIGASMLGVLQLVERSTLPLQVMPAARLTLGLGAPLVGAGLAVLITVGTGRRIELAGLVAPVVGAWLVMALGAWLKVRLEDLRPARVAVVGSRGFASDLAGELDAAEIRGYEVVGWFGEGIAAPHAGGIDRLGGVEEIRSAVVKRRIELLVCAREERFLPGGEAESDPDLCALIADACLDLPVSMIEANQLYEELLGHVPLGTIDSAWFRYIMHPRFRPTSPVWKRGFDLLCGALIGVVAVPLIVAAAIAIKLTDGGPVLYRQRRVGEGGEEFEMLKLRTMVIGAEAGQPQWSEPGDERVTPLGRYLRRTHIDELPQLWNTLRGEMTLVGPRPERPGIVAELERRFPHYGRRHLVKPGITGWAQLRCGYGGSELGTAWKLCHDLFYVKRRSLLLDSLIVVETAVEATRDAHRALRAPRERFIVGEARD
jgi:lipopolysaccharide/colanic/teichoic acid biosynthesis glycosyltransferase